jgi:hypothetical protein
MIHCFTDGRAQHLSSPMLKVHVGSVDVLMMESRIVASIVRVLLQLDVCRLPRHMRTLLIVAMITTVMVSRVSSA